jgi:hypothetical protein
MPSSSPRDDDRHVTITRAGEVLQVQPIRLFRAGTGSRCRAFGGRCRGPSDRSRRRGRGRHLHENNLNGNHRRRSGDSGDRHRHPAAAARRIFRRGPGRPRLTRRSSCRRTRPPPSTAGSPTTSSSLNVPAIDLDTTQQEQLEEFVQVHGRGLLILGGENAFGPGGYYQTPFERLSPLSSRVPHELPQVAIVYVFDRSGSMSAGRRRRHCPTSPSRRH